MAITIWKYTLEIEDVVEIDMPMYAKILHVDSQYDNKLCIWARVNNEETHTIKRKFRIAGTGHPLSVGDYTYDEINWVYHGTAKLFDDSLILHVFEIL